MRNRNRLVEWIIRAPQSSAHQNCAGVWRLSFETSFVKIDVPEIRRDGRVHAVTAPVVIRVLVLDGQEHLPVDVFAGTLIGLDVEIHGYRCFARTLSKDDRVKIIRDCAAFDISHVLEAARSICNKRSVPRCCLGRNVAELGFERWRRLERIRRVVCASSRIERDHVSARRPAYDFYFACGITLASNERREKHRRCYDTLHARLHALDNMSEARITDSNAEPVSTSMSVLNPWRFG